MGRLAETDADIKFDHKSEDSSKLDHSFGTPDLILREICKIHLVIISDCPKMSQAQRNPHEWVDHMRTKKCKKSKFTILTFEAISGQEIFDIYLSE